jgi:CRISPR-associated endonuclease Cas1
MAGLAASVPILRPTDDGVLVLSGYGIRIGVHRRHLIVSDGVGRDRRSGRLSRAVAGLKRLIVLGHSGIVSLESLRWLHGIGAGFIQLDTDGQLIAAFGSIEGDDARLRRTQASAMTSPLGVEIAKSLIREKLRGEHAILAKIDGSAAAGSQLELALEALEKSNHLDAVLMWEAQAAVNYWSAWTSMPVTFAANDRARIPVHWRTFGRRSSSLTGAPRLAVNPANAILNYLYAILEAETRIACLAVGLDPGLGIMHADQRGRQSMVLDIMEAVRPQVDAFLLELLKSRTFRAADFHETPRGQCRVLPPLTHPLAESAPILARRVAPVVEAAAKMLAASSPQIVRIPTPLTQWNRSAGRVLFKRRIATRRTPELVVAKACLMCGETLSSRRRSYCDECVKQVRNEKLPRLLAAGASAIARLAAEGRDPAHGGLAARKRAETIRKRMREASEWARNHHGVPDREYFRREVLPRLQRLTVRQIMESTGLSLRYCSVIRRGLYIPHPRHWESLKSIRHRTTSPARRGSSTW